MEAIKLIIEKLSQYNFLTNIIPGTVLCILMRYFIGYDFIPDDYYLAGIIFYFVGVINGRVGSLLIEPTLKKTKFITRSSYCDFVKAENLDVKINVLNQENNVYRSYISVMLILLLAYIYKNHVSVWDFVTQKEPLFLFSIILVLFLFAYKKQTNYIRKRVQERLKDDLSENNATNKQ